MRRSDHNPVIAAAGSGEHAVAWIETGATLGVEARRLGVMGGLHGNMGPTDCGCVALATAHVPGCARR